MIIDCPHCESKVEAEEKGHVELDLDVVGVPSKFSLVQCKICKEPLLGFSELVQISHDEWDWDNLDRYWPAHLGSGLAITHYGMWHCKT